MSTLSIKMKASETPSLDIILQFLKDSWPFLVAIVSIWKVIAEVAKVYSARQEAKLRALIKETVMPDFNDLRDSIQDLVESNKGLTESINKIKYGK